MPQLVQRRGREHVGVHLEQGQMLERGREADTRDTVMGEREARDPECGSAQALLGLKMVDRAAQR